MLGSVSHPLMRLGGQVRFDRNRDSDDLTLAKKCSETLAKQLAGSLALWLKKIAG